MRKKVFVYILFLSAWGYAQAEGRMDTFGQIQELSKYVSAVNCAPVDLKNTDVLVVEGKEYSIDSLDLIAQSTGLNVSKQMVREILISLEREGVFVSCENLSRTLKAQVRCTTTQGREWDENRLGSRSFVSSDPFREVRQSVNYKTEDDPLNEGVERNYGGVQLGINESSESKTYLEVGGEVSYKKSERAEAFKDPSSLKPNTVITLGNIGKDYGYSVEVIPNGEGKNKVYFKFFNKRF